MARIFSLIAAMDMLMFAYSDIWQHKPDYAWVAWSIFMMLCAIEEKK